MLTHCRYLLTQLLTQNTWSGFEAVKPAPWPNRGLCHLSLVRDRNKHVNYVGEQIVTARH